MPDPMTGKGNFVDVTELRFDLRKDVAIEEFGGRSLVLLCDSLRLLEINNQSQRLLTRLDGKRSIRDIAASVASEYELPVAGALDCTVDALLQMERQGIIRRVVKLRMERLEKMSEANYLVNPEVSFRQEDDGGILFNADSDSLEIINPVAVEIWTFLAAPHTQAAVVAHLCDVCADAPREQVEKDVGEFLESLVKKGFIGIVENPG